MSTVEGLQEEVEHLKEHVLSLESSNSALQAQLVQARAEAQSHLREIAALRRPRPLPPIEYDGLQSLPLEYVHVYEEC